MFEHDNNNEKLEIALKPLKRQLTNVLRNHINTHAITLPTGGKFISVTDNTPLSREVGAFLHDLRDLLDDKGKGLVDLALKRGMEVRKDIRQNIAELALEESFRVDDVSDAMPYKGADRYLNRLYEVICKHNQFRHDSTDFSLWKLTNEDSTELVVPAMWEKAKFTLRATDPAKVSLAQPTVIILPGLTTSNPANIGSSDDESIPLASVITRHVALSGVNFGNAKNPAHNTNVLFMTHGDDYAKLQAWLDITKHNEDIKAGKPADEIYVTPRITAFVEQHLRPLYAPEGEKLDGEQIKHNLSKVLFIGYSAGTSASSMIALALHRDMKKMGFTPDEIASTVPSLHVLNIASVNNPMPLPASPTTLSIQNEHDRYAHLSEFQHSFPAAEKEKDIRSHFVDKQHLLLQPKDPGDCYPSYIINKDATARHMRYRVDEERHNAPSLLGRPIIQANGDGTEIRPPIENPSSPLTHNFISDWHDRAIDTAPAKSAPEEQLVHIRDLADTFKSTWLEKLRQTHLPKRGQAIEPSSGF